MAFTVKKGKVKTIFLPMTPSTAITRGTLVIATSGKLVAATSGSAATNIIGIIDKTIVSTDTDYALDRLVPVIVPVEKCVVYEGDVTSGLVAADVGLDVDLTDGNNINRAATTTKVAVVLKVLSTTKGEFLIRFNGSV